MKNILSLIAFSALTIAFFACSEAPEDDNFVDTTGTLQVIAKDARTDSALTAEVQMLAVDSKARTTDSKGSVVYGNLPLSTGYTIRVSADGYEPMLCQVPPLTGQAVENIYIVENQIFEAPLHKKGVSLEGFLTYANQAEVGDDNIPVDGDSLVEFLIIGPINPCEFENKSFFKGVENGEFKFDSLPEGIVYDLRFKDFKVGDFNFYRDNTGYAAFSGNAVGTTTYLEPLSYTNYVGTDVIPFKITKVNVNTFGELASASTPVKITFSKSVDTDRFENEAPLPPVTINGLDIEYTWNADKTELTITPEDNWNLGNSTTSFTFNKTFYSADKIGQATLNNYIFRLPKAN